MSAAPSVEPSAKRKGSIRTRLTLSHLAVIVVAMVLSGLLLLSFLDRYFMQAMEDNLVAQAQITAQTLIPGAATLDHLTESQAPVSNTLRQQRIDNLYLQTENVAPPAGRLPTGDMDLTYLASASLELGAALDTRIRVLDAQGIVLVDSAGVDQGVDLGMDPLVAQALTGLYASQTNQSGRAPEMHVVVPVAAEGHLVGVVYLSQPLHDVMAVLRDLRTRWGVSMVIALLLSGVVGFLLSGAIARPVRHLTAAAGAVAQGQFEQVPVRSRDELGRLSAAFNEMTVRLHAARQTEIDFVANVSHELRTPLTSVKGLVETLRDGAVDDYQVRDRFLETIEGETNRLISLVNDLLLLSRVDSDALMLRRERIDVSQLARATVDQFVVQAEARDLSLYVEAEPGTPLAWGDPDRIAQVLLNLLDNACKYSKPGGKITVRVAGALEKVVRTQVQDEGVGIPNTVLDRVGERFYRVDKARSRAQGGGGLGLAIARALVEAHGGELRLESEEGQGTTVTFTLPAEP
jgi:two-component system sensor histidine kinase BaeS